MCDLRTPVQRRDAGQAQRAHTNDRSTHSGQTRGTCAHSLTHVAVGDALCCVCAGSSWVEAKKARTFSAAKGYVMVDQMAEIGTIICCAMTRRTVDPALRPWPVPVGRRLHTDSRVSLALRCRTPCTHPQDRPQCRPNAEEASCPRRPRIAPLPIRYYSAIIAAPGIRTIYAHAAPSALRHFDFPIQHAFLAQVPPARPLRVPIPSPLYSAYTTTLIHTTLVRCFD